MHTTISKEFNIRGETFETFDEMYKVNEARGFNEHYTDDYGALDSYEVRGDVYYGFDETKHDVLFGSDIYTKEFEEMRKRVEAQMKSVRVDSLRSRNVRDVIGQSVSVERAMMGHPKSFSHRVVSRYKQKAVHLMYNISCPGGYTARTRMKAGCILMAVIEQLEKAGYQVRLTFNRCAYHGGQPSFFSEICIKDYKTRFNAKKMQFPVCSGSVLFQLMCWSHHRSPIATGNWGYGQGTPVDNNEDRQKMAIDYAKSRKAIYLSTVMFKDELSLDPNRVLEYIFERIEEM